MSEWIPEYRDCPVCGSPKRIMIGERGGDAHRDGLGVKTDIVRCADCTVIYAYPTMMPTSNPYASESEYFHLHDYKKKIAVGKRMAEKAAQMIGRRGKMLEIGCGRGELMQGAWNNGWAVQGVEMTQEFVRGSLPIEIAKAEDCQSLNKKYDFIVLAAVLEHLYEPMVILRRISEALNPGGVFYIEVPNEDSLTFQVGNFYLGRQGRSINLSPTFPPFHVVGFSPSSLRKALNLVGLEPEEVIMQKYSTALPGGNLKRNAEKFAMRIIQTVGHMIGRSDGFEVWARKRE
jgi:Methyltransferase domain